jgi:hypothetical protein
MKKHFIAVPLIVASLAYSSSAAALDLAPVVNAINTASQFLSSVFNTGAAKLAGMIESTSKAQMDTTNRAQEGISKTIIKVDQDRANEQAKMDYQAAPDPCTTGAILRHVAALTSAQAQAAANYRRGGGGGYHPADPDLDQRLNSATLIPGVAAVKSADAHAKSYCTDAEAGQLGLLGSRVCLRQSQLPGADIQADSLFYGAKRKGAAYAGPNLTYSKEQIDAALAYNANTTDPLPAQPVRFAQANVQEGRLYHALWLSAKARIDAADINKRDIIASRTPLLDGRIMLDALKNSNSSEDFGRASNQFYLDSKDRYGFDQGVSPMALLDFDVERRYSNPAWVSQLGAASQGAIAREQAHMLALQLHLQLKQIYQNERIIALLSDQVATSARADMEAKLQAQYGLLANRR